MTNTGNRGTTYQGGCERGGMGGGGGWHHSFNAQGSCETSWWKYVSLLSPFFLPVILWQLDEK